MIQLTVESRDLLQAEKKILLLQAEEIHKMTTLFTQNDTKDQQMSFCEFAQVVTTVFFFSA